MRKSYLVRKSYQKIFQILTILRNTKILLKIWQFSTIQDTKKFLRKFPKIWKFSENLKSFQKCFISPKIFLKSEFFFSKNQKIFWKSKKLSVVPLAMFFQNLKIFPKSKNFLKIWTFQKVKNNVIGKTSPVITTFHLITIISWTVGPHYRL